MGVLANRVRVNTTTTGTGTITLGSAVAGYQTFVQGGITDGQVVSYVIVDNGNAWEVGEGTYGAGGNTLTRTVTESSNADAALNLSGGAQVFIAARAEDFIGALAQAAWNTGTDTTEASISPAKLDDKIENKFNASGAAPLYACRAWVNFNGTGTVAIRASGNVSSITDNGTGDYTVNFTTAMPDADYAMSGMVNDGVNDGYVSRASATSLTASAARIRTRTSGSFKDCSEVYVMVFR